MLVFLSSYSSLRISRSWKECYQRGYLRSNKTFHKQTLWHCLVYAWLVSLMCISIHPLSTYLCNVSSGLCILQFSLTCPVCLIDWLIDWLRGNRMLNYSTAQEIPWHYENRNLITEHPILRQIYPFHVPHNQYLFEIDFNITLISYWLQEWFLLVTFLLYQNSVSNYCSVCMW